MIARGRARQHVRALYWRGVRAPLRILLTTVVIYTMAGPGTAAARADLPTPNGAINDFAEVLSPGEEQTLDRLVTDVEASTTVEIAVATVTSLEGLTIEDYATQLFAAWGIGQSGKDNGVLILVAPGERAMRIEVGYGLEGILPDGLAGQIIRETFLPAFRDGAYGRGIVAGTTRVAEVVRRNEPVTDAQLQAMAAAQGGDAAANDAALPYVLVVFLSLFVAIGFALAGMGAGERAVGPIVFGVFFGGIPTAIVGLSEVTAGRWIVALVAVIAFAAAMRWARRRADRTASRRGGGTPRWTWGAGGSSGRSGSSGGSSGGSSSRSSGSFGGGRSGGGGATGRW